MNAMDERMQKVLESIKASPKEVRLLPVDERVLAECRERLPLNWGSLLGVLLENTGGIVIDGWLRFYGAGELNILERNELVPFRELAIAEDVLGGVFLLLADGNVGYFAPTVWKWRRWSSRRAAFSPGACMATPTFSIPTIGGRAGERTCRNCGAMRGSPFIPSSLPKRTASRAGRAERCP